MRNNNFKRKAHCVYSLTFHVIFVTKFRFQILTPEIISNLQLIIPKLCQDVKCSVLEINGEADHVHFLLETSPQDCLGSLIGYLKCKSSSILKQKFKFPYYGKHVKTLWSKSYFVSSTGGVSIETLKNYVKNQGH